MLRLAQSSLGGVRRLCSADAMRLPYQDETFDLVVCRGGLHHLPDLPDAVREIRRVLRNGGTFLAFDPCDDLLLIRGVRRLMYRLFAFFDADNERGLATREVTTALATTGFDIIEVKRFGFVGYLASGVEAHLFPRLFGCFPRLDRAAAWLCRIDERLEGSPFLLAAACKAVKRSGDAP